MDKNNGVEEKIMNNNPKVASVNMVNDIIGDSYKTVGFKVLVGVLSFCLIAISIAFFIFGKIFLGVVFLAIGVILIYTTSNHKFKRKKYQLDEKKMQDIKPLFKD